MECYVHHVPGRLRIKIPSIKGSAARCAQVKSLLDLYGVGDVAINATTGSIVVHYDTGLVKAETLLTLLRQHGWYDHKNVIGCDEQIQRATRKAAAHVGRAAFGWVVGKALEANGLSLLAVLI
jgi:hypothetical protein